MLALMVMQEPADKLDALVAAARAGDRSSLEQLVRELLPRVRNLVRYLVRGDDEVDDMAQQSLVAIVRGLSSYSGAGAFRAWADRITVRETLHYAKRKRRQRQLQRDEAPDLHLVRGPQDAPDAYLERREVAQHLDALPDEQRQVLILHHVLGMSIPEVAAALGIPFGTVKSRLRTATTKLRARMEKRR